MGTEADSQKLRVRPIPDEQLKKLRTARRVCVLKDFNGEERLLSGEQGAQFRHYWWKPRLGWFLCVVVCYLLGYFGPTGPGMSLEIFGEYRNVAIQVIAKLIVALIGGVLAYPLELLFGMFFEAFPAVHEDVSELVCIANRQRNIPTIVKLLRKGYYALPSLLLFSAAMGQLDPLAPLVIGTESVTGTAYPVTAEDPERPLSAMELLIGASRIFPVSIGEMWAEPNMSGSYYMSSTTYRTQLPPFLYLQCAIDQSTIELCSAPASIVLENPMTNGTLEVITPSSGLYNVTCAICSPYMDVSNNTWLYNWEEESGYETWIPVLVNRSILAAEARMPASMEAWKAFVNLTYETESDKELAMSLCTMREMMITLGQHVFGFLNGVNDGYLFCPEGKICRVDAEASQEYYILSGARYILMCPPVLACLVVLLSVYRTRMVLTRCGLASVAEVSAKQYSTQTIITDLLLEGSACSHYCATDNATSCTRTLATALVVRKDKPNGSAHISWESVGAQEANWLHAHVGSHLLDRRELVDGVDDKRD